MTRQRWTAMTIAYPLWLVLGIFGLTAQQSSTAADADKGFDVTQTQEVTEAPAGWVGRRTIDRTTRVGRLPENRNTRKITVLTMGAFVRRCPSVAGEVAGDFIYDLSVEESSKDGTQVAARRTRHQLQATLKGHVGADGRLQNVDIDAAIALSHDETGQASSARRTRLVANFVHAGVSWPAPTSISYRNSTQWDTSGDDATDGNTAGSMFQIAMAISGQYFRVAETEWNTPNTCVEIKFSPETRTQPFEEGHSYTVSAELRTKEGGDAVTARTNEVLELQVTNNGSVTPKQIEWAAETPAKFTYRAPSSPKPGSGFRVGHVLSRAGVADAEGLLLDAFKISIEHRLWDDTSNATGRIGYALFSGTVKFDVVPKPVASNLPNMLRSEYKVRRELQVTHVTPDCRGSGFEDEKWTLIATVDPTSGTMQLRAHFIRDEARATWQCKRDPKPRDLSVVLHTEIDKLQIPVVVGSMQEVAIRQRRQNRNEVLTVKMLSSPTQPAQ